MEDYIGVKIIAAEPMDLGDYIEYRELDLPDDEDPNKEGYLVWYKNGNQSWSPKKIFNEAYRKISAMTFGLAVEAMKKGKKVARKGWNGKNMFVVYQKGYPSGITCNAQTAKAWGISEGDLFKCEPYLQIQMVNGSHSMWVPSINDVLAEDWVIV